MLLYTVGKKKTNNSLYLMTQTVYYIKEILRFDASYHNAQRSSTDGNLIGF